VYVPVLSKPSTSSKKPILSSKFPLTESNAVTSSPLRIKLLSSTVT